MGFLTRGDNKQVFQTKKEPGLSHAELASGSGPLSNQLQDYHNSSRYQFANDLRTKIKEGQAIKNAEKQRKKEAEIRRENKISKTEKQLSELKKGKYVPGARDKAEKGGGHHLPKIRKEQVGGSGAVGGTVSKGVNEPYKNEKIHDALGSYKIKTGPTKSSYEPTTTIENDSIPKTSSSINDITSHETSNDMHEVIAKKPVKNSDIAIKFAKAKG